MSNKSYKINGFTFSAVKAGIKKKDNLDLGLIISDRKAVAAAVFTKNAIKAAPILVCIDRIKSGHCKGIIVNSGNANAATGEAGLIDAKQMTRYVANALNIDEDDMLVASTGVIGQRLDVQKIKNAVPSLCSSLNADNLEEFAKAIMTTDTFPKISKRTVKIDGKTVNICGVAKGAGMIMPNMATMLAFVMTDANINHKYLHTILKECVDGTFNKITIDGDTSTNDMVLIMANGESDAPEITKESKQSEEFVIALKEVMYDLSAMIIKDGEGATKLIRVSTIGADTESDADKVSRQIANSPLVKTAFFGNDANVGRLLMAIGNSKAKIYPNEIDIYINKIQIIKKGVVSLEKDETKLTEELKGKEIDLTVNLNVGHEKAEIQTCDLTYDYIKVNSAYRT